MTRIRGGKRVSFLFQRKRDLCKQHARHGRSGKRWIQPRCAGYFRSNTLSKTRMDLNTFYRFCKPVNQQQQVHNILENEQQNPLQVLEMSERWLLHAWQPDKLSKEHATAPARWKCTSQYRKIPVISPALTQLCERFWGGLQSGELISGGALQLQ